MRFALAALLLLPSCASHGYARVAPHTDQGYHAQALVVLPIANEVSLEQLVDYQSLDYEPLWIGETHLLFALSRSWSTFVYWRVDDFGEVERRLGAGVQYSW